MPLGSSVGTSTGTSTGTPAVQSTPHTIQQMPGNTPNWVANATVASVTPGLAPPCGWGTSSGETRSGVEWKLTVTGDAISLDEDLSNWPTDDLPYSGHLDGTQFTASYSNGSDYAKYVCQFREATLTGSFTSDSTFDATETLVWGTPATQTTVVRHWNGSKL